CWMFDVRCWMFDVGCWMLDVGCWMLDVGCSMLDVRCSMFDVRCSMFDVGCSMFDVGCSMFDVQNRSMWVFLFPSTHHTRALRLEGGCGGKPAAAWQAHQAKPHEFYQITRRIRLAPPRVHRPSRPGRLRVQPTGLGAFQPAI